MRLKPTTVAFAFGAIVCASQAHANTYALNPYVLTPTYASTSPTVNNKNTTGSDETFTDDFTFSIVTPYDVYTSASFIESKGYSITLADLTLFSGAPGSGTSLATTGSFDPLTGPTPTLTYGLGTGSYYLEAATTVPSGDTGSYSIIATVSSAPEPSIWGLMIVGLGLAGAALRYYPRVAGKSSNMTFAR